MSGPVNGADERELPALPNAAECTMPCEDCDGHGVVGEPVYQGEFQLPEYDRCESCNGTGKWVVQAFTGDQMREYVLADRASLGAAQVPAPIPNEGAWRSCTGCHETNEGRDTGRFSTVFKCALGNGCDECGWVGAIWESAGAAQVPAKPLDDPRLQQAFGDAIEGALAFGFQGNSSPPDGHWLTRFWNLGRAEATKGAAQVPSLRDAEVIERVETEVGMGLGAWDCVDPLEIVAAFRLALSQQGDAK